MSIINSARKLLSSTASRLASTLAAGVVAGVVAVLAVSPLPRQLVEDNDGDDAGGLVKKLVRNEVGRRGTL